MCVLILVRCNGLSPDNVYNVSLSSTVTNLASLAVNPVKSSKSCRKVSSSTQSKSDGTRTSLVAVFKVDSSSCNTKWIILGCVLGGVLLLVVIVMLVVTFNSKAKSFVRPFWARKHG